jgi:hypothetical protein
LDIQTDILSNYPKPIREIYLAVLNAEEPVRQHLNLGYLFEIALKYTSVVSIADDIRSSSVQAITKNFIY